VDFQPLAPGQGGPLVGRVVVTTFGNPWCALLRFNTGDLVRLEDRGACPCGRTRGLTARRIEGRAGNLTLTADGRLVTEAELDDVLGAVEGLVFYQVVQINSRRYAVRCVAEEAKAAAATRAAGRALRRLYGPEARVDAVAAPELQPAESGKFRRACARFPIRIEDCLDDRYA